MNYEQKYKEALNDMRVIYPNLKGEAKLAMEHAFPELAESEDDKIRKALICFLKRDELSNMLTSGVRTLWIAYLEKQKELFESGRGLYYYDGKKLHFQGNPTTEEIQYDFAMSQQEKQKDSSYISETCKDNADSFTDKDERIRKELLEVIKHCYEDGGYALCTDDYKKYSAYLEEQKHQEQCVDVIKMSALLAADRLASAEMTGRLKERKEILENPEKYGLCKPAEKQDYSGLNDLERAVLRGFLAAGFENVPVGIIKETAQECLAQIKPAEWNDTDNIGWDEAFACVTRAEKAAKNEDELQNAVTAENWLKRIKFKYYVHPIKQEWSEEDEKMREHIISDLREFRDCETDEELVSDYEDEIAWLKSLRPDSYKNCNSHWKPSEEQMEALKSTMYDYKDVAWFNNLLSLYNDLHKLI